MLSKGEIAKQSIIESAMNVFAVEGYQKASYEAIAREARTQRVNIQYHFRQKEDLIFACMQKVAHDNQQFVDSRVKLAKGAEQALQVHFEKNLEWFFDHPKQAQVVLIFYYLSCIHSTFGVACQTVLQTGMNRIVEMVELGVREKAFDAVPSAQRMVVSQLLHSSLIGEIIRIVIVPENKRREKLKLANQNMRFLSKRLLLREEG